MASLDQLRVGEIGCIESLEGDPALIQRLYEMGLFEGETLEVIAFAPLGDPVEIRIGSTRLSLRRREAVAVTVRVV
jgi:ferrous iron transport protein A